MASQSSLGGRLCGLCATVVVPVCLGAGAVASQEKPKALLALEQARLSLFSGTVEWTYIDHVRQPGREFRFIDRYAANGDRIFEERGDQDGWVKYGRDGKPRSKFPELIMTNTAGTWRYWDTHMTCDHWKLETEFSDRDYGNRAPTDPELFKDIRFIGIHPTPARSFQDGTLCLWGLHQPTDGSAPVAVDAIKEWRETLREDGKYEVVCAKESGNEVTWVIDPDRGWNAEYMSIGKTGDPSPSVETACVLTKFGEVWFPERIVCRRNGETARTYTMRRAHFNQADDPLRFTPVDFGLEAGFNIIPQNYRSSAAWPEDTLFWDGKGIVTQTEWKDALLSGRKKPGATVQAHIRSGPTFSPYMTDKGRERHEQFHGEMQFRGQQNKPLSVWERYVAAFIERYELNEEQTRKAVQMLRDCQQEGGRYLNRRKSDFYKVQREIDEALRKKDTNDLKKAHDKLCVLRQPVDDLFEKRLKPGLERLPTQAQRKAAQERDEAKKPERDQQQKTSAGGK